MDNKNRTYIKVITSPKGNIETGGIFQEERENISEISLESNYVSYPEMILRCVSRGIKELQMREVDLNNSDIRFELRPS